VRPKGFYAGGTFGSNSHYCAAYVDIDAGTGTGKEAGKAGYMSVAAETMGLFLFHVYG